MFCTSRTPETPDIFTQTPVIIAETVQQLIYILKSRSAVQRNIGGISRGPMSCVRLRVRRVPAGEQHGRGLYYLVLREILPDGDML